MAVDIAVIVVHYRTLELTLGCLASLEPEVGPGIQVVVVDNASGDGSADALERAVADRGWSSWARVLRSPENGGFAAGNNLGVRSTEAAAYLLLNSDTLVRPGALRALRQAVRLHPDAGIVGAGIETAEGGPDWSVFRLTSPLSELVRAANTGPISRALRRFDPILPPGDRPVEADWLGFACVLVRREVFQQVGFLDEDYFMYFEDIDFCRRARRAGWRVLYWPDARVVHLQGGSSRISHSGGLRRRAPAYYYASRARYFAKYYGRGGLWLANGLWHAGRLVSLLREVLGGRTPSHREHESRDIWINAAHPMRPRQGASQ